MQVVYISGFVIWLEQRSRHNGTGIDHWVEGLLFAGNPLIEFEGLDGAQLFDG